MAVSDTCRECGSQAHLDRILAGDELAWSVLVSEYGPLLLSLSRKTFSSYSYRAAPQDPEDAVAEAWKNLVENNLRVLRQCRERNNLLPTLQVLVRNRSIDIMRRSRSAVLDASEIDIAAPQPEANERDEAAAAITPAKMKEAMASLLPRERTLVNLFFLQKKKYREIAELTNIPQNSIGPTLNRAVARLRQILNIEAI